MKNKMVIVIIEYDYSDKERMVIGVASDRENALLIIRDYYGKDSEIKDFKDIRENNLDFSLKVIVKEPLGGTYLLNGIDFEIDGL